MDDSLALFQQYESDYAAKSTSISTGVAAIQALGGERRRNKIREVQITVNEAENTLKRLEMEARHLPADKSKTLMLKVKDYRADFKKLKDQVQGASSGTSSADMAREKLGLETDYSQSGAGQRERMMGATDRLNRTTDRMQHGKQTLAETEELGVAILQDLHGQRETINNARSRLHDADDNIQSGRRILGRMQRRIVQNKIIMVGIIFVLVAAIILILYARFHSR